MKVKILIDATSLLSNLTGIGKYTNEIAKHLETNSTLDIQYFYGYYSKKRMQAGVPSKIKSIKRVVSRVLVLKKIARKLLVLFSKLFAPKFDLYWSPSFITLDGVKASKIVTTVHDFSFYLHPQWHPQERIEYFHKYFFKNLHRSDWIITGSEFSKKEIVKYALYDENKISVIYHGVDQNLYRVYKKATLSSTKEKFQLTDKFILFVGSIEPRKNLMNLLKAYHLLSRDVKVMYPLVLVGFKGWQNKEIMKEIEIEKEHVRYLGYVSDEELAHVYNLATLFVYPSLYEGFGIPPLEAMACGTAVISSGAASLPEACGDAALYIDPLDIEDISKKIEFLLHDVKERDELILKGLERVKSFTWEKSAQEHLKVFEAVLKERKK